MEQQSYKVGIYCRLSRDDDNVGESGSITTQKDIIAQYCKTNDLSICHTYQDDGYSGLNYNRPDFQRLLVDIASGEINCVITKDLSRLGRDYIMTGYYTEVYFPENNVRYIAIGDQYDTAEKNSSSNDFAPFKFIMNDMYAKDLSKKQRASRLSKYMKNEFVGAYAPYGYKKDPDQKNHLIIDNEIAPIVRMIFKMYADGFGRGKLRDYLHEHQIPTPLAVQHMRGERYTEAMEIPKKRYEWSIQTISTIVKNETYLGNIVHFRNRKATHKSKMKKQPKEEQLVMRDVHEPIIDMETWQAVQKQFVMHPDRTIVHRNIFLGVVKCADCGKALNYQRTSPKKNGNFTEYLCCGSYTTFGKTRCSIHYVNYRNLCELLRQRLNSIIGMVNVSESKVREKILQSKLQNDDTNEANIGKKLAQNEKRLGEISRIFAKLYEDRVLENVSEDNFKMLSDKLQVEQAQLKSEIALAQESLIQKVQTDADVGNFMEVIKAMKQIQVLDAQILNALIDRVEISEKTVDENGETFQQIEISYKFIGKLEL